VFVPKDLANLFDWVIERADSQFSSEHELLEKQKVDPQSVVMRLRELGSPPDIEQWITYMGVRKIGCVFGLPLHSVFFNPAFGFEFGWIYDLGPVENGIWSTRLSNPEFWRDTRYVIAYGSSSGLFVDLAPGPDGTHGQIVDFAECGSYQRVIAPSLTAYFEMFLKHGSEIERESTLRPDIHVLQGVNVEPVWTHENPRKAGPA
jgi:hypothetical protein